MRKASGDNQFGHCGFGYGAARYHDPQNVFLVISVIILSVFSFDRPKKTNLLAFDTLLHVANFVIPDL